MNKQMLEMPQNEWTQTKWQNEENSGSVEFRGRNELEQFKGIEQLAVNTTQKTSLRKIAIIGNHLPRQCGIATFTTDLSRAISDEFSTLESFVLAMNDAGQHYTYPARVRVEVAATDIMSYRHAAEFLNVSSVDVISMQHEYGIFGGNAGSHVLALLRELRMPIVTTLHTILAKPDPQQRFVMDELTQLSERLVVMSARSASILREVHNVPDAKIDLIPHGIPKLPSAKRSKKRLGLEGKSIILTFGLLSPDKGIEHVIDALPVILEHYPDTIYIVLGATHPHVKEQHGETYRVMLENRAQRLGVDSSMTFHNHFVSQDELTEFLSAADIYITPYLKPEQSTSGTLAYAIGSGKAVISTPYSYAKELLSGGRGIIVPWPQDDPHGIAQAITSLLSDDNRRIALCKRGAAYGRNMIWPVVARTYIRSFERAQEQHAARPQTVFRANMIVKRLLGLPEINLAHLRLLSDYTGILQHAAFSVPRYEDGYCLDDNARALLLTMFLEDLGFMDITAVRLLATRYLAFVRYAFDTRRGRFKNFMSYSRQWIEEYGSEDSHGRALWALGSVVGNTDSPGRRAIADSLFHAALHTVTGFTSPRAWAYTLLGIDEYLRSCQAERSIHSIRKQLAERLLDLYRRASSPTWSWFEDRATYCNARLSQALIVSGWRMEHEQMKIAGLHSLEWLYKVQHSPSEDGFFAPIGTNGFYERDGTKAMFDQQPVEACAMVSACLAAHRVTGRESWALDARHAFNWFLGQNQLQKPLYDATTGGCRDGLHADRSNENQGAESTLSFLMALVEMHSAAQSSQSEHQDDIMKSDMKETVS